MFDPSGTRMYCTSQRAYRADASAPGPGAVYEISGPFRQAAAGTATSPFGAPAGERRSGPLRGGEGELRVEAPRRIRRRAVLRRGLVIEVGAPPTSRVSAQLDTADLLRDPAPDGTSDRPRTVGLARRSFLGMSRPRRPRLRLSGLGRRRLLRQRTPLIARLLVVAVLPDGRRLSTVRRVRVVR